MSTYIKPTPRHAAGGLRLANLAVIAAAAFTAGITYATLAQPTLAQILALAIWIGGVVATVVVADHIARDWRKP